MPASLDPSNPSPRPRPWRLDEITLVDVRNRPPKVAVVPLGATEPHNYHLPYGTDTFEANLVGDRICSAAYDRGADVVLLPPIPFGTETNLAGFPLAIDVRPATLHAVLDDVLRSLIDSGVDRIVLLNSHGGNTLKPYVRAAPATHDAFVCLINWYAVLGAEYGEIFDVAEDHAGEFETSLMMIAADHLVVRNDDGTLRADEAKTRPSRFEAIERGWVDISRPWVHTTDSSGTANPHAATADKGEQALKMLEERLAPFLIKLSQTPRDESFPMESDE